MSLLKDLISKESITEAPIPANSAELERFNKIQDLIEDNLEYLGRLFKEGSNYGALVEKLGGDTKLFNSMIAQFNEFHDNSLDLHMSVGMAQGEDWDKSNV